MENFFPFFLALSRALLKYLSQCGTTTLHRFSAFKVHKSEGKICFCHPIHIRGRTQPKTIWEKDEAYFSGVKSSTWSENGRTNEILFQNTQFSLLFVESFKFERVKLTFPHSLRSVWQSPWKWPPNCLIKSRFFAFFAQICALKKNNKVDVKIEMWQFRWFSNTVKKY